MGGCGSATKGNQEDFGRSREIDTQLRKDRKVYDREIKLLLLGAGESGKSTIAKQMKIFLSGFTSDERAPFREIIFSNILHSMRSLVLSLHKDNLIGELPEEEQKNARLFLSNTILFEPELTPEIKNALQSLWANPVVKSKYKSTSEYQVNDSASYYFDALDRIAAEDYIPHEQDILRSRARTTGITEIEFSVNETRFRMVDVGGQRSERKKWIHCFQEVTSVIFCVGMSEYDLKLFEDETVNRMSESLMLFEEICNCKWFSDTSIILFLNKSDLFKEKISRIDLKVCFPDYTGGCDYNKGQQFIETKFITLNRNPSKQIYAHITCATDTSNITFVFSVVKETILRMSLAKCDI